MTLKSILLKYIRAGPKINEQTGKKAEARPIIVTVESPDLAKRLHKVPSTVMEIESSAMARSSG